LSSQSLVAPLLECTEDDVDDTELLLAIPKSLGSFFTSPPSFCLGLGELAIPLDCSSVVSKVFS
jgi:hypothetical protein